MKYLLLLSLVVSCTSPEIEALCFVKDGHLMTVVEQGKFGYLVKDRKGVLHYAGPLPLPAPDFLRVDCDLALKVTE